MRMNLRSTLICLAILPGIAHFSQATAADFPGSRTGNPALGVGQNWNGFYVGGHLGYGTGRANSANLSGFTIGAQLGLNVHVGPMVLGGELDATFSGIDYRGFTDKFSQKWLTSGRARAGVAFDRFMPYITAGIAHTSGELKTPTGKSEQGHFGYVIGLGSEAMLTERVSARIEYLHYRFGAQTYTMPAVTRSTGVINNTIRFGLNYRF